MHPPHRTTSLRWLALASLLASCGSRHEGRAPAPAQAPAAPPAAPRYDPLEAFAPLTLPDPVNAYRAGDGAPGPAYWQNRADYELHARLDPTAKVLSATETITYTNNSPEALDCLWLRVEQNAYRRGSRLHLAMPAGPGGFLLATTDGYHFDDVTVDAGGQQTKADYLVSDTRMQIRLARPLAPHGVARLHLAYHYPIPGKHGGRTGWAPSAHGDVFDIAQWYPRMAVFDDVRGWDTLPYLGSEFYLEVGDFDYTVTVPADMLVAGSGELVNPEEVLTAAERARLDQARASDATVTIRSAAEVDDPASRPAASGELTWHFRMKQTRDVAFAASRAYVWDAARIVLPDDRHALAMSLYPAETAAPDGWARSTAYVKAAIEDFSRRWYPYPWPAAIAVAGPVGGMEYPGIVFDGTDSKGKTMFFLTVHELGHSLFPMIVGSNERRDAFMDEGFNTFIDVYAQRDYHHGEFAPKQDHEYAPDTGDPIADIQHVLADPHAPSILTRADAMPFEYGHPVSYFKTALGLVLLREQILGPERFDFAFRKYIRDWAFKHPTPSDFFRAMDSAGGEDLSWFWRGWFFEGWNVDLAVRAVAYRSDAAHGATVTLASLDRLIMPAVVEVAFEGGGTERVRVPAEAWIRQTTVEVPIDSTKPIVSVTLDPDHAIPDADRGNNVLKGPFAAAPAAAAPAK